jgi:hypothetical protein
VIFINISKFFFKKSSKKNIKGMKRTIRLTESELKQLIKESTISVLNEGGFGNVMNRAFQGKKISGYVKNVQDVITAFNNAIKQNPQATQNTIVPMSIKLLNNELATIQNGNLKEYNSPSMNHNIKVLNKHLGTNIQLPENGGIQQAEPQMQQQVEDYHNLSEYQDALNASYYCGYWYKAYNSGDGGRESMSRGEECSNRRDENLRVLAQKYGAQSSQYQAIKQECQRKYYEGEKYYEDEKIGMRRQQAQQYQQQQQQMNARQGRDNYNTSDGIQHYGNGNAYGA